MNYKLIRKHIAALRALQTDNPNDVVNRGNGERRLTEINRTIAELESNMIKDHARDVARNIFCRRVHTAMWKYYLEPQGINHSFPTRTPTMNDLWQWGCLDFDIMLADVDDLLIRQQAEQYLTRMFNFCLPRLFAVKENDVAEVLIDLRDKALELMS